MVYQSTGSIRKTCTFSILFINIYAAVSDFDLERPSKRKVGKGGVALFWKRSIDKRDTLLNIDDDRMIGVQYQITENCFYMLFKCTFRQQITALRNLKTICLNYKIYVVCISIKEP